MENKTIKPGKVWFDTNGERIQAHGAGVFYEDGVYYWIGEDKSHTTKRGKIWTWGIHCYSSTDLCNWKDEGLIVPPNTKDKKSVLHPYRKLDRPHVMKCPNTQKYVMWVKYCDQECHFTVLAADHLKGPYTIVQEKFYAYHCGKCGDFDLAQDAKTGQGYLFFEADHDKVLGCKLSDDYCNVSGDPVTIYENMKPPLIREGITHMERNGKHYILSSGMTGYMPNPSEVAVADDFLGPYHVQGNPHVDDESSASFNSQVSDIFKVEGKVDLYVAVADRWNPSYVVTKERYERVARAIGSNFQKDVKASLKDMLTLFGCPAVKSTDTSVADYVWLPIRFEGDVLKIDWKNEWNPKDYR